MKCSDVRAWFKQQLRDKNYAIDRTGQKTIELIGASFLADEDSIFGKPNQTYIEAEMQWYTSMSLQVRDLGEMLAIAKGEVHANVKHREIPKAWEMAANSWGHVNSNYGYLCLSEANGNQLERCVDQLVKDPFTRRAIMIYTRPTMQTEYNYQGMNDFICTNAVEYYIRDNKLHSVEQMRSNDVVYGYKNDKAWQDKMMVTVASFYNDLTKGDKITIGPMIWQVGNMHVYERHFYLVQNEEKR